LKASVPVLQEEKFSGKQRERARDLLVSVGKMWPAPKGKQLSKARLVAIRAGFRGEEALVILRGVRVVLALLFLAAVFFTGAYTYSPIFILPFAALAGFMIPEIWIIRRMRARQRRLRQGLPDAMDLLVICVEVGLGLDQAIMKVAEELLIAHPDLSQELQMVNLEMRVGKTRVEALRELAHRTGLEDLKALVSMLIQTDRFGTNIAQSLRIFSDELRTKRRQRAEEQSAKTSVKMMAPLVFLIFPALMVVIVGPAVITLVRQLLPVLK
jgi:tight adherence protein C